MNESKFGMSDINGKKFNRVLDEAEKEYNEVECGGRGELDELRPPCPPKEGSQSL